MAANIFVAGSNLENLKSSVSLLDGQSFVKGPLRMPKFAVDQVIVR